MSFAIVLATADRVVVASDSRAWDVKRDAESAVVARKVDIDACGYAFMMTGHPSTCLAWKATQPIPGESARDRARRILDRIDRRTTTTRRFSIAVLRFGGSMADAYLAQCRLTPDGILEVTDEAAASKLPFAASLGWDEDDAAKDALGRRVQIALQARPSEAVMVALAHQMLDTAASHSPKIGGDHHCAVVDAPGSRWLTPTSGPMIADSAFALHGINLHMWDASTEVIRLDQSVPSFALGTPLPSAYGTGAGVWMGKTAPGVYGFRVGDPAGGRLAWDGSALTAAGWTIGATTISGTNVVLDSAGLIRSGATNYTTGTGWIFDYNGGTPRGRIGTTAGNRLAWDGTDLTLVSASATIDANGIAIAPRTADIAFEALKSYKWTVANGNMGISGADTAFSRWMYANSKVTTSGKSAGVELEAIYDVGGTVRSASIEVSADSASSAVLIQGATTISGTQHTTGAVRMSAYGAGTATFDASGNISSSSDARLKEHVAPYGAGLREVLALKPVAFNWNAKSGLDRAHRYVGFLAQDVAAVLPHSTGQDARGYLSLHDRAIMAALVGGMQEQELTIGRAAARAEASLQALVLVTEQLQRTTLALGHIREAYEALRQEIDALKLK